MKALRSVAILLALMLTALACDQDSKTTELDSSAFPLISERPDVWKKHVDPTDPPTFRERVYWIDGELLDDVTMIDGVFATEDSHPIASLTPTDVFVSDWEGGYWMKVDKVAKTPSGKATVHTTRAGIGDVLERGKLVATPQVSATVLPNALAYCGAANCSATVDFDITNASVLQYADAFGGLAIRATQASLDYEPTIRYETGVDLRAGPYTRTMVSGSYTMDAKFEVESDQPSTVRVSYPLPGAGSDSAALSWRSIRNPEVLEPERPAVPVETVVRMLETMPSMSVAYDAGPSLFITAPEGQMFVPYTFYDDSDPINPTGGVDLFNFVTVFNEVYATFDLRATLIQGPGGYSATVLIFRDDPTNIARFSLLGSHFTARPHTNITFSANASRAGKIESAFAVEGRVEAGWICYDSGACNFVGQKVYPETSATADSTVLDGEPWMDFRFQLNPIVEIERGNAPFSKIMAGGIKTRANFETQPPSCVNRDQLSFEQYARRLGRLFPTQDVEMIDNTGFSNEVEGCTGTGQPPADCSICENSGTPNCVANICGAGMACYFGKCSKPADFDITMTWDFSQPHVDLDLWVEMPDSTLIHAGQLTSGPAEMANVSDGAVSSSTEEAGGYCEGIEDRDCTEYTAENCPSTCRILTRAGTGTCLQGPTTCAEWFAEFQHCPSICKVFCDPNVDPHCPNSCFQQTDGSDDLCFECDGQLQMDKGCWNQTSRQACESQDPSCGWSESQGPSYCVGGRLRCELMDEERCERALRCNWIQPPAVERLEFPPYMERVVFNRAMDQPLKFWVVNKSGIDTGEQIPFEISVRMRVDEDYKLQGFVGPNPGEQSIQYRYELRESQ